MRRTRFPMPPEMLAQIKLRESKDEADRLLKAKLDAQPRPYKIIPEKPNKEGY